VRIKGRADLLSWLRLRKDLDDKRKKLVRSLDNINTAVLAYYERHNLADVVDPETHTKWQKRQGTTQIWNNAELKLLLKRRRVPEELVFTIVPTEVRNDEAIFQLMRDGILSIDDIEGVSTLQTHKPYIVGMNNAKKHGDQESDD
jgi:hypothetical protein